MKINSMQAPSTLIPEYIGSSFDAVLEVASNIEAVKVVAENVDTFGVPLASETTTGIAEIATQAEVNQKTNDSHIVTPKKLGAYAAPLVHNHATATSTESGFLSATDKQKLDGIAKNANNYIHPTGDGNLHVPPTGTNNNGKFLKAGATAGLMSWAAISKTDVGLSNVDNTSDLNKPISTATQNALDGKSATGHTHNYLPLTGGTLTGALSGTTFTGALAGNASTATKLATARTINGVSFDGSANITINAVDSTSRIASSEKGVANGVATLGSDGKISSSQLPAYTAGAVDSVAGKTGVVTLVKADVGLSNVDNTSDINKPISSSQQSALDLKANIASPALTGTPSAPTATVGTSTTQIATTAFVNAEIANDATPKSHVGSTGSAHGVATTSVDGFMSAADKVKLDSMGSGGDYTHPVSGVTAGTYKSVTVDINGHVTSGTNPTTLAGYGITDATPSSHIGSTGSSHGLATTSVAGFMSAADKTKLDGLSGGGTGDQTITLTGDVTGSGTGSFATTLANSGVTAGTYPKVTVDTKGRVTAGASLAASDIPSLNWSKITSGKPTTLSGYGITDAVVNTTTINGKPLTTDITLTATDVGAIGATVATTTTDGLMSSADKTKLDNLSSGGTYIHPTGDGSLHVPATGTTSNGKFLKAGSTAGSLTWATVTKTDVGLSNVDNTSDVSKPISTATQTALATKADTNHVHEVVTTSVAGFMSSADKTKLDGIAAGANAYTHPTSGATAGTYRSVTVNTQGHITAGTNPTTLAGYGITDATASSHVGSTGTAHGVATQKVAGFMSSADKLKLDNLSSGGVVDSADKLTTPRSINGTSFDGTTDITTSNWGTSRTLTIGGVSKSVDGSSNVTWNASEMGFLPSTGGSLSGKLTITSGGLEVSSLLRVFDVDYPEKYCSLGLVDNVATITAANTITSGFKVMQGSSTYFYVSPSGQLYAQGVYMVYHTNNKPTAADVGLGLVNNTADLDKPISTAMQAALNTKYSSTNKPSAADIGALPASGTAVAATKLATARTIAGKSFDGTANISITAADVGALSTSGGSLSGNLNAWGTITLADVAATLGICNSFGRNIVRGSNVAVNVFGNTTDAMYFDGNSLTAWQVRYGSTLYPIYHKGNKPTPAEIGAQPATSDSRVKSNITSLPPVLDKIMLIDPKTFTMEGREGTCVGTIAQDWEVDFPEVILNVPSTSQGEPEMLKGIDALGTIGILLKAIQELKGELEDLKNR